MTTKTSTLKCDLDSNEQTVTYRQCKRVGDAWETEQQQTFSLANLPTEIQAWCGVYGLRAVLADRTSDSKKLNVNKLDWMKELYSQFESGVWNKPRATTPQVDRALVHLIVELKGCTAVEAEAALKAADKDWIAAAKERYAEELNRIRGELANAEKVDLTDL